MIKCRKEKAFLIFTNEEGQTVRYNLADGSFTGKSGRPVKTVGSFFAHCSIEEIEWANPVHKEWVKCLSRTYRRIRNIGSFLTLLKDNQATEQWLAMGFTPNRAVHASPSAYSKGFIVFCKQHDVHLYRSLHASRMVQEFLGTYYLQNKDLIDELLSNERGCNRSSILSIITGLIERFGCRPTALLSQLLEYTRREGIAVLEAVHTLHDYHRMARTMTPKYHKYPRYLLSVHNITLKNYNAYREQYDEQAFKQNVDKSLAHRGVQYSIIVPEKGSDIQTEGALMHHCVASYVRSVIAGQTQIVFLRSNKDLEKPLVTVEVRDSAIVQARRAYNDKVSAEERIFLETYARAHSLEIGGSW